MKFLCDNCKAKYQIADEKLQGRAVQMKCRKCGHLIEVPALGPAPAASSSASASPGAPAQAAPAPAAAPASSHVAAKPQAPKPAPAAARPAAPARPASAARPAAAQAKAAQAKAATPTPSPAKAKVQPQGLAGAFAQTVTEPEPASALDALAASISEEWYVGINGVPLGPVGLPVMRQKALQNAINEESLVWREGFDEWLPLRQFPELTKLVQEAREHAVPGVTLPTPQRVSSFPQALARGGPSARASGSGRFAQMQAPAAAHAALDPSLTTSTPQPAALDAASLSAAGPVLAGVTPPAAASAVQTDVMLDPFAAPAEAAVPIAGPPRVSLMPESLARPSVVDEVAHGVRKQVRLHPAAVAFIGLLGVFGGVLITVWLTGGKTAAQPPPTVQIVTVVASGNDFPPPPPASSAIAMAETTAVGGVRPAVTAGGSAPSKTEPAKKEEPKSAAAAPLNTGLDMGTGLAGPTVGGPGGGTANATLPQLEQADIQRVVSSNVGFVRRQCWEPALAARSPNAPGSAKVTVMVTIGPDGRVQSANASGGSGYPDLASCVSSRVRGWKFPASSGTSTANIPFVFAAQ